MDYFLQLRHFRCALFTMIVRNCLKYDWNRFEKENTVNTTYAAQVCHIGYIQYKCNVNNIIVCLESGFNGEVLKNYTKIWI